VALLFLASEISVIKTTDVNHLWLVSATLGLSYGCMFNVIPMLVLEWFGMSESLVVVTGILEAVG